MDPTLKEFLRTWDWRIEILMPQIILAVLYVRGWLVLRQKGAKLARVWRLGTYLTGWVLLIIALQSGVDAFSTFLFFMHMIQHQLMMMLVPPLLFLSAPMPISFWGLPRRWRFQIGRLFSKGATVRQGLVALSTPGFIWLLFTCTLWLWHDPNAYDTATENQFIHDIEHLMFFASALLLWWHIIGAAPRIHKGRSYLVRMVIVALAFFQNLIVGITITMWGDVIYKHYLDVPRLWNITPKDDQTFGGLIMWLGGGMMYMMTLLILIGLYISEASRKSRAKEKLQKQHKASLA